MLAIFTMCIETTINVVSTVLIELLKRIRKGYEINRIDYIPTDRNFSFGKQLPPPNRSVTFQI